MISIRVVLSPVGFRARTNPLSSSCVTFRPGPAIGKSVSRCLPHPQTTVFEGDIETADLPLSRRSRLSPKLVEMAYLDDDTRHPLEYLTWMKQHAFRYFLAVREMLSWSVRCPVASCGVSFKPVRHVQHRCPYKTRRFEFLFYHEILHRIKF